jgi:hypothetical protein
LKNNLGEAKTNAILGYLERSKKIEIDLDGNIISMSGQENNQTSIAEEASFSSDFTNHLKSRYTFEVEEGKYLPKNLISGYSFLD